MIGQTFPDIVVQDDSEVRVVTHAARRWLYENTNIKDGTDISGPDSVPKIVSLDSRTHQSMEDDGLVVMRDRRPVSQRLKDQSLPSTGRTLLESDDQYDGHRARFEDVTLEVYREQRRTMRSMNRWYFRNRRLMQEAAEKRKVLQDNQLDS